MKKMTYDEYECFCIEKREQFYEEFDEFIDMENPADLKFNIDFGEIYSIAAVNKDADVVAAFLPDDDYIFYATSVSEVIKYIGIIYPEYKEELMDNFVELQGMHRIHRIEFFPSNWEMFTSDGCRTFDFEPSSYDNEDEACQEWIDWCNDLCIDDNSIEKFMTDVKIHTSLQEYSSDSTEDEKEEDE